VGFWIFIALVVAFVAYQRASRAERVALEQKKELEQLRAWLQAWYEKGTAAQAATASQPADAAAAATPAVVPIATTPLQPTPTEPTVVQPAGMEPAAVGPTAVQWVPTEPAAAIAASTLAASATAASTGEPAAQPFAAASASRPAAAGVPGRASAARRQEAADSLENRIGGRWLLYIGLAALVLGASYFVKYAFDNEWISPSLRVGLGLLGGAVLIAAGQRFVVKGLALYGQALSGGGIGVLYLAIYAAYRWYDLINEPAASAAMILTTALGVWLADRQRSQPLALLAITVGFATPFLIGDSAGSQAVLFTYDAILVCGTLALARRREWPALNLVSYVLTTVTIASWFEAGYKPKEYLVTELFLTLFLVLFLYIWRETRRYAAPIPVVGTAATPGPTDALIQLASLLLALAPALYHLASLAILFPQRGALLVYLIAFSAAGVIAARRLAQPWLRGLVWVGVAIPLLAFFRPGLPGGWVPAAWIALLAVYGLHTFAQVDRVQDEEPGTRLPGLEVFLLHANGIWLMLAADALIAPRIVGIAPRVTLALAVWYGLLTVAARGWRTDVALHTTALTMTFTAAAAALFFDGPWLTVALALDGAALVWLALRADSRWMRVWGHVILVIGIVRALALLGEPAPVSYLPVFNPHALAGLFVVAVLFGLARFHPRKRTSGPAWLPGARDVLIVSANLLALIVISSEIDAFFNRRAWTASLERGRGAETTAELSRQLSLSIAWAVYAVGLVFAGIRRRYRPIRYLAIFVFGITILKVFTVDLATLDRVSKMLSVMGLGILLLIASYLYQRVSAQAPAPEPPPEPQPAPEPEPARGAEPAAAPMNADDLR
jgi:uncharacterized membrane protein